MRRILFIVFVLLSQAVVAQVALVKAIADKDTILLGEPFWLTLEIRAPKNSNLTPFKIDTIPHFEFLKKDSVWKGEEGGATVIRQYFQLTSFDSGKWVIPPFELRQFVKTNSLLMNVVFTSPFDPSQPYHDIQDVRSVPINKSQLLLWVALALALLLLIVIIIYFATNKKLKFLPHWQKDTPYEAAIKGLKNLKTQKPEEKLLYENLVNIFRTYVLRRTGIESLHQTSNDLVEKLKPLYDEGKDEEKYISITQVMLLSDFVKFAKYEPDASESESAYEVVEQSVNHIEDKMKLLQQAKTSSPAGGGREGTK